MSRPALRARETYSYWNRVSLRWNDNDVYGHVNNAVYQVWFDTTMNAFLIENGLLDIVAGDTAAYVVQSTCRYARPLRYPGEAEIGLVSAVLGTSSLTWHFGAFSPGNPDAAAEATFVQVTVDPGTGRAVPVPERWRQVIAERPGLRPGPAKGQSPLGSP